MNYTKKEVKHLVGCILDGTPKQEYIKNNGDKGEKCRLYIQSQPNNEGAVSEVAVTCCGELANFFYYRGMVDVQYVQRVYNPKPNIFINDAYAVDIKVV